jgi:signal transduction histidine kinase
MSASNEINEALLFRAERAQNLHADELHDTLCQSLAGISLLVKVLVRRAEGGGKIEVGEISRISDYLDESIDQLRAPARVQALLMHEMGLVEALEDLSRYTSRKTKCHFAHFGEVSVTDTQVTRVLYRIARETIGQMLKQSGTQQISISLARKAALVILEVENHCTRCSSDIDIAPTEFDFLRRCADARGIRFAVKAKPDRGVCVQCVSLLKDQ